MSQELNSQMIESYRQEYSRTQIPRDIGLDQTSNRFQSTAQSILFLTTTEIAGYMLETTKEMNLTMSQIH